jgi:hypothetical protein
MECTPFAMDALPRCGLVYLLAVGMPFCFFLIFIFPFCCCPRSIVGYWTVLVAPDCVPLLSMDPLDFARSPPPPVIPLPSRHYIIQRRTATLDQKNVSICVCVCVLLPGEAKEFPTPGEYLKKRPGETGVVGRLERAKPAARVSIYHREKHKRERERNLQEYTHIDCVHLWNLTDKFFRTKSSGGKKNKFLFFSYRRFSSRRQWQMLSFIKPPALSLL